MKVVAVKQVEKGQNAILIEHIPVEKFMLAEEVVIDRTGALIRLGE
jgi:hypothetical protein